MSAEDKDCRDFYPLHIVNRRLLLLLLYPFQLFTFSVKRAEIVCVHPQNITLTPDPATLRNCSLSPLERDSNTAQRVSAQWTDLVFFETAAFLSPATVFMAYYIYCTALFRYQRKRSPNQGWAEVATELNKAVMMGLLLLPDTASLTHWLFCLLPLASLSYYLFVYTHWPKGRLEPTQSYSIKTAKN